MKLTLTLSGLLTHSHMIGSCWGGAAVATMPFSPIFDSFPFSFLFSVFRTLSHQCPDLFSAVLCL